jgi:hypothetical protein
MTRYNMHIASADEASGATTAAAKNSSRTKEEPQDDDKEYIDSGHNSVSEGEESDVETEGDEQGKEGGAAPPIDSNDGAFGQLCVVKRIVCGSW